jgi:hypothetical protein
MDNPITTATAPLSVLNLFPELQPADQQANPTPPYDTTKGFKDWVDPQALTAPVTTSADPVTGIWYIDSNNVLYPILSYTVGVGGNVSVQYSHLLLTRAEAAAYNVPNLAVEQYPPNVNPSRPVPRRSLAACESLIAPNPFSVLVQNNTLFQAQQQAEAAKQAAAAATTDPTLAQILRYTQWLCANFGMKNVSYPS